MRRRIIIGIAIITLIVGVGSGWWQRQRASGTAAVQVVTADRQSVVQDVTFTGQVRSQQAAHLAFAVGGQITDVAVAVGDVVAAGDVLVRLDARTAAADAAVAAANLASGQEQTRLAWDTAQKNLTLVKTENARSLAAQQQKVRDAKTEAEQTLAVWQTKVQESGDESSIAKSAYAAYLTAQTAYHAAQTSLTTLQATTAKSTSAAATATAAAEADYLATVQAATATTGPSALAATAQRAQAVLALHTLRAPFAGTVTHIDSRLGEYAAPGVAMITVETAAALEVVAQVVETDAVRLIPDMTASIAFDALASSETWAAHVTSVAPAAQMVEGVPTYEVILTLDQEQPELRPGLTANITVHAAERDQVIAIPRRAVKNTAGRVTVEIQQADGTTREQEVTTGLVGSNGMIEVTQGIVAGDQVVVHRPDEE